MAPVVTLVTSPVTGFTVAFDGVLLVHIPPETESERPIVYPVAPHKVAEPPVIADGAAVLTVTAFVAIGALLPQADVAVKE